MEILKYFKTPSLKYFVKFLIVIIKWLKTFKKMIKVYEVSRKYIMLFVYNNRYLPVTGLLTLLQWTIQPAPIVCREIFEIFQKYFTKYEAFHAKKFREILHRFLVDCQSVSEVRAVYETHRWAVWSWSSADSRLWKQPTPLLAQDAVHLQWRQPWRYRIAFELSFKLRRVEFRVEFRLLLEVLLDDFLWPKFTGWFAVLY